MSNYSFGTIIELTEQQLLELQEVCVEDIKLLNEWDAADADIATPLVKEMASWLYPQPEVIEFDKNSAGDQIAKFDLAFKFPAVLDEDGTILNEAKIVAFQVKSSEYWAVEHMKKNKKGSDYKGSHYPCPGVFFVKEVSWGALIALARFTGVIVSPELEQKVFKTLKFKRMAEKGAVGPWLPIRQYQKLISEPLLMQRLGIIALGGGRITFLI